MNQKISYNLYSYNRRKHYIKGNLDYINQKT